MPSGFSIGGVHSSSLFTGSVLGWDAELDEDGPAAQHTPVGRGDRRVRSAAGTAEFLRPAVLVVLAVAGPHGGALAVVVSAVVGERACAAAGDESLLHWQCSRASSSIVFWWPMHVHTTLRHLRPCSAQSVMCGTLPLSLNVPGFMRPRTEVRPSSTRSDARPSILRGDR